jgi:hypothetical protein
MNFGRKKFMVRNDSKKKTLVFDCYNLIDPIEQGAVIFWGWCPTKKLLDLMVAFLVSYI